MEDDRVKVLVVCESGDHTDLIADALRSELGAAVRCCATAAEAAARPEGERPDVVVLGCAAPPAEGWDGLVSLGRQLDCPVIVVVSAGGQRAAVEAVKAGAGDRAPAEGAYLRALPAVVLRAAEADRKRGEELVQLSRTSQALADSPALGPAVSAALEGVMALLPAEAAWLLLPREGGGLELVGAVNVPAGAAAEPGAGFGSRGSAPVPVRDGGSAGLLCAGARREHAFGSHHLELLGTIASQTGSAVENARLFERLCRAKAEWERTFDSIPDPIVISDDSLRVLRLNRAAARCFNTPLRQAPGQVCHRLILGAEEPCPWHDALVRGVPVSMDRYLSHLQRWFSLSAFPFADGEGRPVGVVHVLRDITEERRLQQRMHQAQKLAAIGELVAGVAHELNNPLTGILGFSQLLLRETPDTPFRGDLEQIASEARRAARIVRNLSAFARQQPLSRRLVDVNELLEKTVELRHYQLRVAGTSIGLDLAQGLPRVLADPDELQQVFLNIVNNAEQAMMGQASPKRLTVRTLEPWEGAVRVEFRDTGPGLPDEALDRIFDPFFTTKEAGRGTGLGLSVCYGIVRGHGGQIAAASHPEGGAVFTIDLPVGVGSLSQECPESREPGPAPAAPARILVVDDEPVVGAFVGRTLAQDGHQVELATDGEGALAKLREGGYDLVVCDLKLPDISGPQLYDRVLAEAPKMGSRFVFCTGDTLGRETAEFLRARRGPWLEKPLMPEDLKRVVNHYLATQAPPGE